jgi:hypothetical protein
VDEKRESFYGAFIQKKHKHMPKKKLILVNWVVFFAFKPSNVDEKQKGIIPWFTHPKENFHKCTKHYQILVFNYYMVISSIKCNNVDKKPKKIILWVHPFQGKHIQYTKTY